jgi:hypothetical protein
LLMKIVGEVSRPDGTHFEERMLEPPQNRSVVSFKVASGQLELLEYPEESVALEIEVEPLRHLARPLPVRSVYRVRSCCQSARQVACTRIITPPGQK